jgi:hypothetical protein
MKTLLVVLGGLLRRSPICTVVVPLVVLIALTGCGAAESAPAESWHVTFDDGAGWVMSSDAVADVAVVDGALQVHVIEPGQIAWGSSERSWRDLHLTVDATQVSGPLDNEYGVLLRMKDDQDFLAFSVSGDGYVRAARYGSGTWTVLGSDWTPSDAVRQGEATNRLEIVAQGGQFEFTVNGQSVLQVEDAALVQGTIGLYAGAFSEGDVVVSFDNLDVEPVP